MGHDDGSNAIVEEDRNATSARHGFAPTKTSTASSSSRMRRNEHHAPPPTKAAAGPRVMEMGRAGLFVSDMK